AKLTLSLESTSFRLHNVALRFGIYTFGIQRFRLQRSQELLKNVLFINLRLPWALSVVSFPFSVVDCSLLDMEAENATALPDCAS
ncbi:MAG: hypothetical protein K1W37_11410, partial [Lachnospiraceae bacterium]